MAGLTGLRNCRSHATGTLENARPAPIPFSTFSSRSPPHNCLSTMKALLCVLALLLLSVRSQCPPDVSWAMWKQCNSNAAGVACEMPSLSGSADGLVSTPSAGRSHLCRSTARACLLQTSARYGHSSQQPFAPLGQPQSKHRRACTCLSDRRPCLRAHPGSYQRSSSPPMARPAAVVIQDIRPTHRAMRRAPSPS